MRVLLSLMLLALLASAGVGVTVYRRTGEPYKTYSAAEQFVEITPGSSTRTIGDDLINVGVVRDTVTFRAALWRTGAARALKAGTYRFDAPMSAMDVVRKLEKGDTWVKRLTFPEGLTMMEMARVFEQQKFGPASEFLASARDAGPIGNVDPAAGDLEGYLFPETYTLPPNVTGSRLVHVMVDRFEQLFTEDLREAAEALGMTTREAVTLASIVEKETARAEERPIVAAVYLNRLKAHMPLQCDPTVIYGLVKAGRYDGNIHKTDLSFDSPYNTYHYPGLPPGPIASPGRASLDAALHPADADFLYFVSRNDGSHEFARTLEEHNRNVQKYQVQYFRDQKAGRVRAR
jgi:UPF0755 protein